MLIIHNQFTWHAHSKKMFTCDFCQITYSVLNLPLFLCFPLSLYIALNSTKVPVPDCIPVMVLNYWRSALSHILPNLSNRSLVDLLKILYIVVASNFWSPWFKIRHTWESTSYYPIILPFLFLRSLRDLPLIEIGLVGTLRNNNFQCHYFLCQDFLTMIPDRKPFH